jgi:hypothetical protein
MRSRYLLVVAVFVFCTSAAAQSIVVTPKRVVYKRTGRNVPDFKRTFEVRYPIFSGKLTPVARRGLRSGTDYWRIFDMKLADNLRDDHWLSNLDYEVKYNKYNILDIWLFVEGVAAYPDGSSKYLVFDIRTGRKLDYSDLFISSRMRDLLSKIRAVMKHSEAEALKDSEEMRETLAYYRNFTPEFHPTPDKIEFKNLDGFTISDTGVTFLYDYGYAHVAQALEPPGEFFLSYAELKPFIRPDGLLARFVR